MSSTFLQLQSAHVVAEDINRPRPILRLESGTGVTFTVTATTNVITATIATDDSGSVQRQTVALAASTAFERRDGVVVASAFTYNAGDYTGTKTMKAILASADGAVVRARLFDLAAASYIASAALTTTSATPTILQSSTITLASSDKLYEVHVDVDGSGDNTDRGVCSYCEIRSS